MAHHILLPRVMSLPEQSDRAARHEEPRHALALLSDSLQATVHEPGGTPPQRPGLADRLRAVVIPPQSLWDLARSVAACTGAGDTIFCPSEAGGLQLAALLSARTTHRPRLAMFVHNIDRPRARWALNRWKMARTVDVFFACSQAQVEFLRNELKLSEDRVRFIWDHTDTRFFTPGKPSPSKTRPVVASVGLEQRDYVTLAAATADLDVDVRISGFSKDSATLARSFPKELPSNMSRRFYEWCDLVQLYRDADVVVVSCYENKYAAGVQSLMEASACRRPIVATLTKGLSAYLGKHTVAVLPGDTKAMRAAILSSIDDPAVAETRAALGYVEATERYDLNRYVDNLSAAMHSLASRTINRSQ